LAMVRFERDQDRWEVHYSIAQPFRRRGIARKSLATAVLELRSHEPAAWVFGQVKKSNEASRRIFQSLGFRELPETKDGVIAYEILADSVRSFAAADAQRLHANR
jgi:RimJ/RimL family protein N-acetyltransferase